MHRPRHGRDPRVRSDRGGPSRRGLLLRTLVAWVWVFVCFMTWSLATPFFTSPDAQAHDLMSWHVVRGDLLPQQTDVLHAGVTSNAVTQAPEGLARAAESIDCYKHQPDVTAACLVPPTDDGPVVDYVNPAGRNFPTYYLATGWPSLFTDGAAALWAMRTAAAALAALFVAWAITAATTRVRSATAVAGVAVALPPMTMYMGGAINPNSTEITAAMALAACSVVFLREPDTWLGRVMYRRAMIAAAVMVTIRLLAPVWVLVWVVAFALVATRPVWREVLTRRGLSWAALPFVGTLFNLAWTKLAGMTEFQAEPKHDLGLWDAFWASKTFIDDWGTVVSHVGSFGWVDTNLRPEHYYYYAFTVVFVVALGWVFLPRREALVTVWLLGASYLVPVVLQALQWNTNGGVWQGRYTLPLTVMIPIMTLMLAADRLREPRLAPVARRVSLVLPLALLVLLWVHVKAIGVQLQRNTVGVSGLAPVEDQWVPPLPTGVLTALLAVTLLLAWGAFVLAARREASRVEPGRVPTASTQPVEQAG